MNKQKNNDNIQKIKISINKNKPNHCSLNKKIKKYNISQKQKKNKENISPLNSRNENKYKKYINL